MDFIGWFLVGFVAAVLIAASLWGRRDTLKRAADARAWASARGLIELPSGKEGVPSDLAVKRRVAIPSFVGMLDGREVSVIATSTTPRRGGDLWALCTHASRPPLFLGHLVDFSAANVFGQATPKTWVHASAGLELDAHFFSSVPGPGLEPVLSPDARAALLEAGLHVFAFNANPSGFTVLWFRQKWGEDTKEALTQAARMLSRLLA